MFSDLKITVLAVSKANNVVQGSKYAIKGRCVCPGNGLVEGQRNMCMNPRDGN